MHADPPPVGKGTRTIKVDLLTRVEGEGALYVKLRQGRVLDVQLRIFEPPRFFEAFLRGRHATEVADITARICGICPVAYQMSAVHAVERILGVRPHPAIRLLRRLLYCGEWIESHALHVFLLHAPDFLGYPDGIAMARDHRGAVEKGLGIKKAGNELVTVLGGREIHPVSVTVGGFTRAPRRHEFAEVREKLLRARDRAIEAAQWAAGFDYPDFEHDYEFVALSHPEEYPMNEGRVVSNRGLDIDPEEFDSVFAERHVPYSNALQGERHGGGCYLVGPLARYSLNFDRLPEVARETARRCGLGPVCRNPFRSLLVRLVEIVCACDEAVRLIGEYEPPPEPAAKLEWRPGAGWAATEAPRGILYHRYAIDASGLIEEARIIPPTSQNQKRIEQDLWRLVPGLVARPQDEVRHLCEQAIRNYDPCISCATHFLKLEIEEADA